MVITKGKHFNVDLACERRSSFSTVNSLFNKSHLAFDMVKLHVCESHCLSITTMYSLESLSLSNAQLHDFNSWWNSVYRKISKYSKWELVSELIFRLERLHFITLHCLREAKYIISLHCTSNSVICNINAFYVYSAECQMFLW
jgi:hypothetical protein